MVPKTNKNDKAAAKKSETAGSKKQKRAPEPEPSSTSEEEEIVTDDSYTSDESSSEDQSESGSEQSSEELSSGDDETSDEEDEEEETSDEEEDEEEDEDTSSEEEEEEEKPKLTKKAAKPEHQSEPSDSTLFVGGLSYEVTEDDLRDFFSGCGEINQVRLIVDRQTGKSKGIAYVDFESGSSVSEAIDSLQGASLKDRPVRLDTARAKSFQNKPSNPSPTPLLFVGNLSYSATESSLKEAFAPFGDVLSVRIPSSSHDPRPKGFAYVQFKSVEGAKAAMAAPRIKIDDRIVRLDYESGEKSENKRPFQPRDGSGFRGGRGGRGARGGRGDRGGRGGQRRFFD